MLQTLVNLKSFSIAKDSGLTSWFIWGNNYFYVAFSFLITGTSEISCGWQHYQPSVIHQSWLKHLKVILWTVLGIESGPYPILKMFLNIFSAMWWLSVLISLWSARCTSLQCLKDTEAGFSLLPSHQFYRTMRVFLQHLYRLESTKPCQNIAL